MRARLSLPITPTTLLRRLGGCVAALALGLALAATPAASAPSRGAKSAPVTKAKARSTAKRKTAKSARSAKSAARTRRPATAAAEAVPAPLAALPELLPVDLGAFGSLALAEPASAGGAGVAAPAEGAPVELPKPFAAFSRSASSLLDALTERARSQLGTRYVLGASSPGGALDCSAFTRFAMEALGLRLPRTAAQQARVGVAVPRDRNRLRPGDLLTFGRGRTVSHVGIYLGDGRFIHASVKSGQVIETTFAKNAQLLRRWLGARRLLAGADSASGAASGG